MLKQIFALADALLLLVGRCVLDIWQLAQVDGTLGDGLELLALELAQFDAHQVVDGIGEQQDLNALLLEDL